MFTFSLKHKGQKSVSQHSVLCVYMYVINVNYTNSMLQAID